MLKFLFLVVSTLLAIGECAVVIDKQQQHLGQWRPSILAEFTPQVIGFQANAQFTWFTETVKKSQHKKSIDRVKSRAKSTIESKLADLDSKVGEAIRKASKSGKNISQCILDEQQSRWSEFDEKNLSQCVKSGSFFSIQLKLSKFILISADSGTIVPTCTLFHPFSNNKFKTCLDDELNKLKTQLSTVKKEIDDDLNAISNNAKSCIADNLESSQKEIKNILNDFTKCVRKAKKIDIINVDSN